MKSWMTFVERKQRQDGFNECDEDDPRLFQTLTSLPRKKRPS
jgi:hypothetical protein